MDETYLSRVVHDCENCRIAIVDKEPHLLKLTIQQLNDHMQRISIFIQEAIHQDLLQNLRHNLSALRLMAEEILSSLDSQAQEALSLNPHTVLHMRSLGMPWSKIGNIHGISRNTMYKYRKQHEISEPNPKISEDDLFNFIQDSVSHNPNAGVSLMHGSVVAAGYRVSRQKVLQTLRSVDPEGVASRRKKAIRRRRFTQPYANGLWSVDSNHKLIAYKIVLHGCIDAMSRKIIYVKATHDNKSQTVLRFFKQGIADFGLPKRVRADKGGENILTRLVMQENSTSTNPFLAGPSVHNQRIERLWGDVNKNVEHVYKPIFEDLQAQGLLSQGDNIDLFCLLYVYLPRIDVAVQDFVNNWNNHSMRELKNKTPNQVWTVSMLTQGLYGQSFILEEDEERFEEIANNPEHECIVVSIIIPEKEGVDAEEECRRIVPNPLEDDGYFGQNHYFALRGHLRRIFYSL